MATIDAKEIVNAIAAGKYASDRPVAITEYKNHWGNRTWGVCFEGEDPNRYLTPTAAYINSPKLIWQRSDGWVKELIK